VVAYQETSGQVCNGLVTARHPLAAEAGLDVLRRGGNALDAAATILATGVVQPFATTIGGGGLLTAVRPDRQDALAFRARGRPDLLRDDASGGVW
jgi:gamma-glutamyltranspeptidase